MCPRNIPEENVPPHTNKNRKLFLWMSPFCGITIALLVFLLITTSNAKQNKYVNAYLDSQNAARRAMGMSPLNWDPEVAAYAQWYPEQRRLDCELKHSNGPYGENIFWGSGDGWTPTQAAVAWLSEKKWYNYWSNSCESGEQCGHYTQIMWSGTKRVGCARVVCDDAKGVFITCNYDPPGNFIGEKPY